MKHEGYPYGLAECWLKVQRTVLSECYVITSTDLDFEAIY